MGLAPSNKMVSVLPNPREAILPPTDGIYPNLHHRWGCGDDRGRNTEDHKHSDSWDIEIHTNDTPQTKGMLVEAAGTSHSTNESKIQWGLWL